jgi:hypothetical protein
VTGDNLATMGTDFLLNVVAIPADREPDWDAAARRIDALGLEDLDRFFGYWDPDGNGSKEAVADDEYLPNLKGELRTELDNVRSSLDQYSRESATFEFREFRFLATGVSRPERCLPSSTTRSPDCTRSERSGWRDSSRSASTARMTERSETSRHRRSERPPAEVARFRPGRVALRPALSLFEPVLVELQRSRVLGDGTDDIVGEPVLGRRSDLDPHRDLRANVPDEVLHHLVRDLASIT